MILFRFPSEAPSSVQWGSSRSRFHLKRIYRPAARACFYERPSVLVVLLVTFWETDWFRLCVEFDVLEFANNSRSSLIFAYMYRYPVSRCFVNAFAGLTCLSARAGVEPVLPVASHSKRDLKLPSFERELRRRLEAWIWHQKSKIVFLF